jgi:Ca-activated chloride channel family protein
VSGLMLLEPAWLLLAALIPIALLVARRRRAAAVPFADEVEDLPRTLRARMVGAPAVLEVVGLLLVVVALARPARREPLPIETEGVDILLCVDASSSMRSDDMDERRTRLDVAKAAAVRFVAGRPHDRIGLLTFARYPDVRCPLTLDHDALRSILAGVSTVESDGPEDATGIGAALARAAQVLRAGAAKSKVAILLTDGAENLAARPAAGEIAPAAAAQLCREVGVRAYTIVAAADASGEARTRKLAEATGGRFFAARDAAAVEGVYASIDELEKATLPESRWRVEDRFAPFLAVALALVLAAALLRATVLDVLP